MFNAPLGDSSMLPVAVAKLMDEGLDAGERVSKKKKEHSINTILSRLIKFLTKNHTKNDLILKKNLALIVINELTIWPQVFEE